MRESEKEFLDDLYFFSKVLLFFVIFLSLSSLSVSLFKLALPPPINFYLSTQSPVAGMPRTHPGTAIVN